MDIRRMLRQALVDLNDPLAWSRIGDWMRRNGYLNEVGGQALRWEYKVLQFNKAYGPERHEEALNAVGLEGWELVGIDAIGGDFVSVRYVFKRLLSSQTHPSETSEQDDVEGRVLPQS